jgi:hypothetical protein
MTKHIIIEATDERVAELEALAAQAGVSTVQLLNVGLTLAGWYLTVLAAGRVLASVDEVNQSYAQLVIPDFPHTT